MQRVQDGRELFLVGSAQLGGPFLEDAFSRRRDLFLDEAGLLFQLLVLLFLQVVQRLLVTGLLVGLLTVVSGLLIFQECLLASL